MLKLLEQNTDSKTTLKNLPGGTIGHIGCTSFFPTKNLGCYVNGEEQFLLKIRLLPRG
jgi:hypothetical protein